MVCFTYIYCRQLAIYIFSIGTGKLMSFCISNHWRSSKSSQYLEYSTLNLAGIQCKSNHRVVYINGINKTIVFCVDCHTPADISCINLSCQMQDCYLQCVFGHSYMRTCRSLRLSANSFESSWSRTHLEKKCTCTVQYMVQADTQCVLAYMSIKT